MKILREYETIAKRGEKAFLLQTMADVNLSATRMEKILGVKIDFDASPYWKSTEGKRQKERKLAAMERFYAAQMEKPENERVSFFK